MLGLALSSLETLFIYLNSKTNSLCCCRSSEATDIFDVSSFQESIMDRDEPGKDFQKKIEEYREFIALKELLDSKSLVNTRVVINCLKQ